MVQTIPGPRMTDPEPPLLDIQALEAMARQLEASGRYRLLRRFEECTLTKPTDPASLRSGIYLDVETTGKNAARDGVQDQARDGVERHPLVPVDRVLGFGDAPGRSRQRVDALADGHGRAARERALGQEFEVVQAGAMHVLVAGGTAVGGG